MEANPRVLHLSNGLAQTCGALVAATGGLAGLAWLLDRQPLAAFGVDVIPVAPSTAWLMLGAGLGLLLRARWPDHRVVHAYIHTLAALITTVAACVLVGFWWGFDVVFEEWLAATRPHVDGYPTGNMAVLTALLFQVYAVTVWSETSLATRWPRWRLLAVAGAGLMVFTTVVVLLTHLAGGALLYSSGRVPIAVATTVLFLVLGSGLLARSPLGRWLLDLVATRPRGGWSARRFEWTLAASVTAMFALLIAVGVIYLRRQVAEARQAAEQELSTMADLKVNQLVRWREERKGDARFFFHAPFTGVDVQAFLSRPNSVQARTNLAYWLNLLKAGDRYRSVALFDTEGQLRLSLPETREAPGPATRQFVAGVLRGRDVVMGNLQRDDAQEHHLDLGFPVFAPGTARQVVGMILLRLDSRQFLYPLLRSWPKPSDTADTLLVRLDGDTVIVLNEPRFPSGPASAAWLEERVRRREPGVFEARDHRATTVLAALRAVPGSDWHIVVKGDLAEVYAGARRQAWTASSTLVLVALALGMGAGLLWQQHNREQLATAMRELKERRRIEQALRDSEERLRTIVEHSSQVFFAHTPGGVLTYVSPQSKKFFGYEPAEALGPWERFLSDHPANKIGQQHSEDALRAGERQSPYELELVTRDGRKVWVEVNESPVVEQGRTVALVGSLTDITRRKRSEQIVHRLSQLGRDLAAVSDAHEAARAVADAALDLLGWDACFMKVRSPDLSRAEYALSMDTVNGRRAEVVPTLEDEITPIERRVMTEGPQLILRTADEAVAGFTPFGDTGRRSASLLYVPLRHRTRHLGLLSIQSYRPEAYDRTALELLQALADHAAGALERIRAEHALRASEDRYRQLFEAESDAILLIENASGRILQANGAASALYGYSRDELVTLHNTDLSAEPDETQRVTRETVLDADRVITIPLRWHRRRDGTRFPVEMTGRFFTLEDRAVHIVAVRDITERKRVEEALRESELKFRSIVQASPLGLYLYVATPDGRLILSGANPAAARMLGIDHRELLGRTIEEAFPALARTEIPRRYLAAARDGVPWQTSLIEYADDRIKGAFEVWAFQTAPGQMVVLFQEITARRQAEDNQRRLAAENERLLRRLQLHFSSMPIGCIVLRPDLTVQDWNVAATRIFGFPREAMLDRSPLADIADNDVRVELEHLFRDAQAGNESLTRTLPNRTSDGGVLTCEWHATPLHDPAGEAVGFLAMVQDITERLRAEAALRETERQLSTLVGNLPAGFAYRCRNDRDWTMEFITAGSQTLLGCAAADLTSGRVVYSALIHPEDRERVWQEIQAAVAVPRSYQLEYRIVTGQQQEKWVWEQGCGVFDEHGQVLALEGLVTDITARRHAEAALRELTGRLLAAQDAERRRIARELHDTTAQTLAALCMNLTLLETQVAADSGPGGAAARTGQLLADAQALGERAAQEIRTMSYLLHPPILEHAGLAGAIREYAAGFSRRSGIQVQVVIGEGVRRFPPEVELALLRLVQESLGNVHRHSGSPTARIHLGVSGGDAVLEVSDAGRGFRVPEDAGEGHVGVGIAGMRERLRHLGGRFEIASGPQGTTVRATLPLPAAGTSANS